ncbi:MAG TPA: hypothetical protein PL033_16235 [Candidatus Brocadiia bacterium]|nr:hypothetical protein [Candidatus Brocadiia bacterium]
MRPRLAVSYPIATAGWAMLCLTIPFLARAARCDNLVLEQDFSSRPIELESPGAVYSWKEKDSLYFCSQKGMTIRMGGAQVSADAATVWFDQAEAQKTRDIVLSVYAEGNVAVVDSRRVQKGDSVYLHLRSAQGVVWYFHPEEASQPRKDLAIYAKARVVEERQSEDYISDQIIAVPPPPKPIETRLEVFFDEVYGPFPDPDDRTQIAFVFMGNCRLKYGEVQLGAETVVIWMGKEEYLRTSDYIPREVYASKVSYFNPEKYRTASRIREHYKNRKKNKEIDEDQDLALGFVENVDLLKCGEIYFNTRRLQGQATNIQLRSRAGNLGFPIIIEARLVKMLDRDTYSASDVMFTTCDYGEPHYVVRGRKIRLFMVQNKRVVSARDGTAELFGSSVLYVPFMSSKFSNDGYFLEKLSVGQKRRFGYYMRTIWDLADVGVGTETIRPLLHLDYFSERGPGAGLDLKYNDLFKHSHFGKFESYYINDQAGSDRNDIPIEDPNRGRFLWRHRSQWTDELRTDAEFSYLSDRTFLKEYYEDEYYKGKEQESLLYTRYRSGTSMTGVVVKSRTNDWQTQLEHYPLIRNDVVGYPIADGILNYSARNEVGAYRILYGSDLPGQDTPITTRLHTGHKIDAPFRVGPVNFDPYQEISATYAAHGREQLGPDPWDVRYTHGADRVALATGMDASTTMWRIYDTQNDAFKLNRLRHVVTPETGVRYTPKVWGTADDFITYDDLDMIDDELALRLAVRQRWQTKRGPSINPRTVDWVRFDTEYYAFPGSYGMNETRRDYLEVDFANQLTDEIAIESEENRIDTVGHGVTSAGAGVSWRFMPPWESFLGYRYEEGLSDYAVATLEWMMNPRWTILLQESYDLRARSGSMGFFDRTVSRLGIQRMLHMWVAEFNVKYNAVSDDMAFSVDFTHRGGERRAKTQDNW